MFLLGLSLAGSAGAGDAALGAGGWLAQEVRGTVLVRAAGEAASSWQPLQRATPLAGQSEIATGSDGMAVLANGVDQIRLSPNSRLVLPEQEAGLLTLIRQSLGKIFFQVGKLPDRSFEVDAPYMVVLVKGTQFTVNATYMGNSVAVTDGTVEVRSVGGGEASGTLISAGQTASVAAGGGTIEVQPSGGSPHGDGAGPGKGGSEPQSKPLLRRAPDGGGEGEGDGDGGGTGGGGAGGDPDPGDGGGGDPDPGDGGDPDPGDGGDCPHNGHGHHGDHTGESED